MSITSANAQIMLAVPGVFSAPQAMQQFSADDIFTNEDIEAAQVMMGVDGGLAAGFVYSPQPWTVSLMANSPSIDFFDTWYNANKRAVDVYRCNGTIWLPSVKKKFDMVNGALTRYRPMSDAAKVLRPRAFVIVWEAVNPAPIG